MERLLTIVGMGGGISYGVALKFGHEGYKIAMISRNEAKLKAFKDRFTDDGIDSTYFIADAGVEKSLKNAFQSLAQRWGDTEVLLFNAAYAKNKHILSETPASLAADFKVNVGGALSSVKMVLPAMRKANRGSLLFTGGGLALKPHPNYGSLALGKAGLLNLTKQLHLDLAGTNIKVGTVVVQGFVKADDLKYNPTAIADQFWSIHHQPGKEISEIIY